MLHPQRKQLLKVTRFVLFLLVVFTGSLSANGQTSPYLQNPDLLIDYVNTNASFWKNVYDGSRGGFYTNVNRQGQVISAWGRDKDVLTQSRDA